jgi:hypothetical protein
MALCARCGGIGRFKCAHCDEPYCGKECQTHAWKNGHKQSCPRLPQELASGWKFNTKLPLPKIPLFEQAKPLVCEPRDYVFGFKNLRAALNTLEPCDRVADCAVGVQLILALHDMLRDRNVLVISATFTWKHMHRAIQVAEHSGDHSLYPGYYSVEDQGMLASLEQLPTSAVGQWLLGPDKKTGNYVGMGFDGYKRMPLSDWHAAIVRALRRDTAALWAKLRTLCRNAANDRLYAALTTVERGLENGALRKENYTMYRRPPT